MFHVLLAFTAARAPPYVPPPQVQKVAPRPVQVAPGAARTIRFGPDIVVKEIRKDGPSAVRVLIANEGTVDITGSFQLAAYAAGPGVSALGPPPMLLSAGPLKAGASQWVRIGTFVTAPPAAERALTLADLSTVTVVADVYGGSGGILGVPGPMPTTPSSFGSGGNTCTTERGCVAELDETNNSLTVPVSAMSDYTGP